MTPHTPKLILPLRRRAVALPQALTTAVLESWMSTLPSTPPTDVLDSAPVFQFENPAIPYAPTHIISIPRCIVPPPSPTAGPTSVMVSGL